VVAEDVLKKEKEERNKKLRQSWGKKFKKMRKDSKKIRRDNEKRKVVSIKGKE